LQTQTIQEFSKTGLFIDHFKNGIKFWCFKDKRMSIKANEFELVFRYTKFQKEDSGRLSKDSSIIRICFNRESIF